MRIAGLTLASAVALAFSAVNAEARETYHGFVKDSFYLGRGGTPASLEQVADNPLAVFRSELAYANLRAHIGSYLGTPLDDAGFRVLMRSDRVRLVPCTGLVDTSGVTVTGKFGWHERSCYTNEWLIEITLDDGRRVIVASQGCYNPVRSRIPSLPPVIYTLPATPPPAPELRDYTANTTHDVLVGEYPDIDIVIVNSSSASASASSHSGGSSGHHGKNHGKKKD